MTSLVVFLMGVCLGTIIGIFFLFGLMGKPMRDAFFGQKAEKKPIVINWIDGHDQDINIMMRGALIFTGKIGSMNINLNTRLGPRTVGIELISKAEVMRDVSR